MTILLTGGGGFLGRVLKTRLERDGYTIIAPRSAVCDLRLPKCVDALFAANHFDAVIHAAASVGGIGWNMTHGASLMRDNLLMGVNLIDVAVRSGVKKLMVIGTACSYPLNAPVPIQESSLWDGYPEPTNAGYGIAKRTVMEYASRCAAEHGIVSVNAILANLFGVGDEIDTAKSHVIPAIIRKVLEAKRDGKDTVGLWGDGSATRDFLYVDDAADGIAVLMEMCGESGTFNIATGAEWPISCIASEIEDCCGWNGEFVFDRSKPNGQPRRRLCIRRMFDEFRWLAKTDFRYGIAATVADIKRRILWHGG